MPYSGTEQQREYQRKWAARRRERERAAKLELKRKGCSLCPEVAPECLDFHHVDPTTKSFTIGRGTRGSSMRTPKAVRAEAAKCIVVCKNCHAKIHSGAIRLDVVKRAARAA